MDVLIDGIKVAALGIGVTFTMLFLIVGFVKILKPILDACMSFAQWLKNPFKKKEETILADNETVTVVQQNNDNCNEQIVAAIIAAICYETGMSSDMFVLKGIRRRKSN